MKNLSKIIFKRHMFLAFSIFCLFLFVSAAFAKDMTIKLIAVNATEEEKEIDVKSLLPKELKPEDILDMGKLKLDCSCSRSRLTCVPVGK